MAGVPEARYARSGDLSIAYTDLGKGPPEIVFVPGFVSHAELIWDFPIFRFILERLRSFGRLLTFDKRGTGLSDRSLGFGTAEDRMDDIRAVMDHAGVERAAIVGISEGGPLATLFAATYPERVTALALWGTYARALGAPDYSGVDPATAERFVEWLQKKWGTGRALRAFVYEIPDDPETNRLLARYERNASTPAMAGEIMRSNLELDVRSALPALNVPTLVLHHSGDPLVPVDEGRYLARHIADARLVELPGDLHLSGAVGGEDAALDELEEFLTGRRIQPEVERVLKTILFTDIVASTERAAKMGDRRWKELLDAHDALARRQLERFGGTEVNTTGDGFLASFDGPARGVRCAQTMVEEARTVGVDVRAGLHTGECEVRGKDLSGMAVHIGARVAALAGPGELLVTRTVRDLVAGSGIEFVDRGTHELRGVPGEWHVLGVTS